LSSVAPTPLDEVASRLDESLLATSQSNLAELLAEEWAGLERDGNQNQIHLVRLGTATGEIPTRLGYSSFSSARIAITIRR